MDMMSQAIWGELRVGKQHYQYLTWFMRITRAIAGPAGEGSGPIPTSA
jgi:hypothetical protein